MPFTKPQESSVFREEGVHADFFVFRSIFCNLLAFNNRLKVSQSSERIS